MKILGIKGLDYLEIIPIEFEKITSNGPINAINCSIFVSAQEFSGKGEFWAGSNWHEFLQNLLELDKNLIGNADLEWKVGMDQRMFLSIFNLDNQGHLFIKINILSDENYSDKNKTISMVQTGFEIDPNSLSKFIKDLRAIWTK